MKSRHIRYIEPTEDLVQQQVDWALTKTMDELLLIYCKHLIVNYSMAGIDILTMPICKRIYYLEDEF